ncbi:protein PIF-like isoform X2 [Mizuhopecten yessoensis]|uniref:protein PIF-like isoform X2 n=1 Tax=Mizuhopecten yessoensis TaxID=6573 RepID=UPI000B45AA94|nr:protein PIF-like isoform X2 [Mizuhopecten yessoensis]
MYCAVAVAHAEPIKPLVSIISASPLARPPIKSHGDIAVALSRGNTNIDIKGACSESIMVEGVGYARHPTECEKFIQCFLKESGVWYNKVQSCGVGEFWDHALLACRIAEVVDCPNDRCKDPSVTSVPHSDNCRAYYHCETGRSVGQCCPNGSSFVSERGCVNHTTCSQECQLEVIPKPGFCDRAPVFGRPKVYSQYVGTGSFWIEMLCANGSWYNDRKCGCFEKIMKPWDTEINNRNSICRPEVYLPFCGGLMDQSGHDNVIENEGDRVFVIDGKAYFNGHSTLYIPSFSDAHYGDSVVIKLKYKMANRTPEGGGDHTEQYGDFDYYNSNDESYGFNDEYDQDEDDKLYRTMALVSNGDCDNDYTWSGSCYENPTITIATNRRTTIFDVQTSEDEHETQMEVHKKHDKTLHDDVDYYDDEYYSYLFENRFHDDSNNCTNDTWDDEWRTVMFLVHNNTFSVYDNNLHDQSPVSGFVKTTSAGLQFGQGSGFRNFKGYMDEIYVYLCRPDDAILFDNVNNTETGYTTSELNIEEATREIYPDVRTYPKTSIGTTEVEISRDALVSRSSVMTESTVTEYDQLYLTRIIAEALDSEFSTTTETMDLPEVTSLEDNSTSFKESVTAFFDSEATLKNSASTLSITSSSIIDITSSSETEITSNSLSDSSSMSSDAKQPIVGNTETFIETSSIALNTSYQTTFVPAVKDYSTGSKLPLIDGELKNLNNVTSVTDMLERSDSYNSSYEYNITTQSPFVDNTKVTDNITIPNITLRDIVLKNNSLISLITGKNIDLNSKKNASNLDLGNETLQLLNNSESKGNHCCINSNLHGATGMHNQTAQSVLKTNGAIIHNENGQHSDNEGRIAGNNSLTMAIQTTDRPTPGDTTVPGSAVTQSFKFTNWLFAKYGSDYRSENGRSRGTDSETNVTSSRPEN